MLRNINKIISCILIGSFAVSNLSVYAVGYDGSIQLKESLYTEEKSALTKTEAETGIEVNWDNYELVKSPSFDEESLNLEDDSAFDLYSYVNLYNKEKEEYTDLDKSAMILELKMENPITGYLDEAYNFIPAKSGTIKGTIGVKGVAEKIAIPIEFNSKLTKEKGSIKISFIDRDSKEELREAMYIVGIDKDETIEISPEVISKYKALSEKIAVTITEDDMDQTVTFEYSKAIDDNDKVNAGKITINCIDKKTGETIANTVESNKSFGEYNYKAQAIEGYIISANNETKTVIIDEQNKEAVITFEYEKVEVVGTITINYIDEDTKLDIADEVVMDVDLGETILEPLDIKGYRLVEPLVAKVNITEDNLHQNVTFKYSKIFKTEATYTKDMLKTFLDNGEGMSIFTTTLTLKIKQADLQKIYSTLDEIKLTVLEEPFNREEVLELFKENELDVLDTFSVETNLKEMPDNMVIELIRKQLDLFEVENFYLYRVDSKTKALTLEYIGEGYLTLREGTFKVPSASMDGSTFVVTANKKDTDKVESVDNIINNNISEDKDKIPDTSGIATVLKILSIASIVASVIFIRKKNKQMNTLK